MSSKPLAWMDQPSPRVTMVRKSSWTTVRGFARSAFPGVTVRKVVQSFSEASQERQLYLGHRPKSAQCPAGAQVGRLNLSPPVRRPQSAVVARVKAGPLSRRERTFNRPLSPTRQGEHQPKTPAELAARITEFERQIREFKSLLPLAQEHAAVATSFPTPGTPASPKPTPSSHQNHDDTTKTPSTKHSHPFILRKMSSDMSLMGSDTGSPASKAGREESAPLSWRRGTRLFKPKFEKPQRCAFLPGGSLPAGMDTYTFPVIFDLIDEEDRPLVEDALREADEEMVERARDLQFQELVELQALACGPAGHAGFRRRAPMALGLYIDVCSMRE